MLLFDYANHNADHQIVNAKDLAITTSSLDLTLVGAINRIGNSIRFALNESCFHTTGCVYIWVEQTGEDYAVVYVGMAGRTLNGRMKQHEAGFRSSKTGLERAALVNSGFDAGCVYHIYARQSETVTLFGQAGLSMAPVEELALQRLLNPHWNRTKFRVPNSE